MGKQVRVAQKRVEPPREEASTVWYQVARFSVTNNRSQPTCAGSHNWRTTGQRFNRGQPKTLVIGRYDGYICSTVDHRHFLARSCSQELHALANVQIRCKLTQLL